MHNYSSGTVIQTFGTPHVKGGKQPVYSSRRNQRHRRRTPSYTRPRTETQASPRRIHPVGKQHQHKSSGIPTSRRESATRRHESSRATRKPLQAAASLYETARVVTSLPKEPTTRAANSINPPQATSSLPEHLQGARETPTSRHEPPTNRREPPQDNREPTRTSPRSPRDTNQPLQATTSHPQGRPEKTHREDAPSRGPDPRRDEDGLTK